MTTDLHRNQVSLIVTVDVDPAWHGYDLPEAEAEEIVVRAIDAGRGLTVAESYSVVTPC